MQRIAEEVLDDMRRCPPAPGFDRVEVPGEREREYRDKTMESGIALPRQTLKQIHALARRLSI
jgi:LDH2 family malate/lactate/ureidoglycolate dehydrogenase